ncbi:11905_t:CDS:1, partial [Dentiscutata erythropus]
LYASYDVNIFEQISYYSPKIFKNFIIIFLSRGLSVSEANMIEKYDFDNRYEPIYFWFDKERSHLSRNNHVSFDKLSFNYLKRLEKEELEKKNDSKSDDVDDIELGRRTYYVKYFKDNHMTFSIMLFLDFY